jgi:hypothetical protein
MFLNCERAELNRSTGELVTHYFGTVSTVKDPIYGVQISEQPECAECQVKFSEGENAVSIDGRLYHPGCAYCNCRVCSSQDEVVEIHLTPAIAQKAVRQPALL